MLNIDKNYDVIVVGAGPGGSIAAKEAAEKGLKVLLLERDREVGLPVRCAEGVGIKGLLEFFDKDHWILKKYSKTYQLRFVAPNGEPLDLYNRSEAAVLDRKDFDFELGRLAGIAGAKVITMANVIGLLKDKDNRVTGVKFLYQDKEYDINSKIVIAADGIESRVGRWAGINTTPKFDELEACAQYTMTDVDIDENRFDFYFGEDIAPEGYLWVFPKGDRTANIGVGVSGSYSKKKKAITYLNEFVEKNFPNGSIVNQTCGGVVCSETLEQISTDGLLIVGDSAHQTNAISGGGIINAMKAGREAANVSKKAVDKNDFSAKFLKKYDKQWYKVQGKMNHKFYLLNQAIDGITDKTLDDVTAKLNSQKPEKRTLINVFKKVLLKHPKLILELPKLFG